MIKSILLIILLSNLSLANDLDIKFVGILHSESEESQGREGSNSLPKERNTYSSLYSTLLLDYDINEDLFLSLGAKGNIVLGENTYHTPAYLRGKMFSEDINQAIISEASINFDNNLFTLNLGRQNVDYDWLRGSIDGLLAMIGSDDDTSLRLFWFKNYVNLQYNYFVEINNINANKGMFGSIAKLNKTPLELTLFNYYIKDLRNIFGLHATYTSDNFGINLSYSGAIALDLALYDYDEEFLNLSVEYLYKRHYMELGFSKTGENGLLAMIQMGNFMFGQFYLSNQTDRENALNTYIKYIYAKKRWRLECIAGASQYDNSFIRLEKELLSSEIDIYLKYKFTPNLSVDFGAMAMRVEDRDPLQVDQNLLMLNVVYEYENY